MTTYSVILTDSERRQVSEALAMLVRKFTNAKLEIEPTPGAQADKLPSPAQPEPAVAPTLNPRDRWARDRKGIESPQPKGCYSVNVHLFKAERADLSDGRPRMLLAFDSPTGKGSVDATCWDEKLFGWLALAKTQPAALLHVVKSGKYLNVVGVRA